MMNDQETKRELLRILTEAKALQLRLDTLVAGRKVKVISDFNGQPYGRSRRSLRGQTLTVERAHIDTHWGLSFATEEERLFIRENEVEWL